MLKVSQITYKQPFGQKLRSWLIPRLSVLTKLLAAEVSFPNTSIILSLYSDIFVTKPNSLDRFVLILAQDVFLLFTYNGL